MSNIKVPGKGQVSTEAQVIFDQLQHRLGKVPNLYATIGYSANALKGFLEFESTLNDGAFTPKEREAIALIVSELNKCDYCLSAHTLLAIKNGFTREETLQIRRGVVDDSKLNAILQLAISIVKNKGKAEQGLISAFFEAGFNEAAMMELVGLITVRVFTNYVYALTDIPVDFPLAVPIQ
ncbi:carboxymuconolactone decarboxylase family protein [Chitinophaga sp. HK235]|uniref:carboxymuconolactone decarboxylase family protein n=1 Tax=Chitinophaga sp. HK235 TaxID=2952571 RepID=UPI001BA77D03|nr:carboxymuconolactone decarboxylase family protein [Chitinophaga sp. HK235]